MRVEPSIVSLDVIAANASLTRSEKQPGVSSGSSVKDAVVIASAERSAVNRPEGGVTTEGENLSAARSLIKDAGAAQEILAFAKKNILLQADVSIRGQANLDRESVLELLRQ
ncbi:MAG: hypothetical protein LBT08_09025 [Synergistaceae bacterium]|nr:hypothetical protein [Synergistaceae bacterium]